MIQICYDNSAYEEELLKYLFCYECTMYQRFRAF